jgi:hypothetical protein
VVEAASPHCLYNSADRMLDLIQIEVGPGRIDEQRVLRD